MVQSILFVCLGNICRSPLAEGIFRSLVVDAGLADKFSIDSAGTGAWHEGSPPDPRSIKIAAGHGIDISGQRARQVTARDFSECNLILAMDNDNLSTLSARAERGPYQLRLFLKTPPQDVPDPYYGGASGFEDVYQHIKTGGEVLLQQLIEHDEG